MVDAGGVDAEVEFGGFSGSMNAEDRGDFDFRIVSYYRPFREYQHGSASSVYSARNSFFGTTATCRYPVMTI